MPQLLAALVGAFFGAASAFYFERWQRSREEERQHVTAGNVALASVRQNYEDYLTVRKGLGQQIALNDPAGPQWTGLLEPLRYNFSKSASFDIAALSFLIERGDVSVLDKLFMVAQRHAHLVDLATSAERWGVLAQEKIGAVRIPSGAGIDVSTLEAILGPYLAGSLMKATEGLVECFDKDEADYVAARDMLHDELVRLYGAKRRFGKRHTILKPIKKVGF